MATERNPKTRPARARAAAPPVERVRIPLPPLPALRRDSRAARPAAAPGPAAPEALERGLSREEADLLLGEPHDPHGSGRVPGAGHEGRAADLPEGVAAGRTGALGATILNDLVDEIEKDLELEVERHASTARLPAYRRALGCSFVPVEGEAQEPPDTRDRFDE